MTAALTCMRCGAELRPSAKFRDECGSPTAVPGTPAGYKQVTVLFADVVGSMDIAAAVGAERLREIITELVTHAAAVVQRHGGTVDKFTGDGIMAVFGAPAALEDHGWGTPATGVLVETLLDRGADCDEAEAEAAIERLAAAPTDDGLAVRDIWLLRLRALLARAHGDAAAYAHFKDRYRDMARTLGFEGHIASVDAMP